MDDHRRGALERGGDPLASLGGFHPIHPRPAGGHALGGTPPLGLADSTHAVVLTTGLQGSPTSAAEMSGFEQQTAECVIHILSFIHDFPETPAPQMIELSRSMKSTLPFHIYAHDTIEDLYGILARKEEAQARRARDPDDELSGGDESSDTASDKNTKAEIADSCKRLGVKVNESDTKGQMLRALRNKLNADAKSPTSKAPKDATSDEAPNDSEDASSSSNRHAICALACAMADMNERMNKLDHRVLELEWESAD